MTEPDGPCGCVGMHPGQSHDDHRDALDKRRNKRLLDVAADESQPPMRRLLALWAHADGEIVRVQEKRRRLEAER